MSECSYAQGYDLYPSDTSGSRKIFDTAAILPVMDDWRDRAKRRMTQLVPPVTQQDLAPVFGVKTRGAVGHYLGGRNEPSIDSLVKLADRLEMSLDELLRGGATQSHSQVPRLTGEMILAAYQEAVVKVEALGLSGGQFHPLSDPDHAGLLAMALTAQLAPPRPDSSIQVKVEVGSGAARKDPTRSGTAGEDRPAEAGRKRAKAG